MKKFLPFAVLGLAAVAFVVAEPAVSQAQYSIQFGYSRGYSSPRYYGGSPRYYGSFNYGNYGRSRRYYDYGHRQYGYSHGLNGYYGSGRGVIVRPERLHWTPRRGLHTHGSVIVPHRGHYHVYPY